MMENIETEMEVSPPGEEVLPDVGEEVLPEVDESLLDVEGEEPTIPTQGEEFNHLTHKVKDEGVTLWILGDSHLRGNHHFPALYLAAKREEKTDPRFGKPKRKTDWEDKERGFAEGFFMDEAYKGQVLDLVESSRGKATAILLSTGTNNIRVVARETEAQAVVQRVSAIIQKVQETPGVFLYLLEPVPHKKEVGGIREYLSKGLAAACGGHAKVRWISLTTGAGAVFPQGYQPEFWADDWHLNREGAALLLTAFIKATRGTRSDYFLVDPEARVPRRNAKRDLTTKKTSSKKKPDAEDKSGQQGNLHQTRSGKVQKGKKVGQHISPALKARLGPRAQGGGGQPSTNPPKVQPRPKKGQSGAQRSVATLPPPPPTEYYTLLKAKVWAQCQQDIAEIERCQKLGVRVGERRLQSEPTPAVRSLLAPPQQPVHHPGPGGNGVGPLGGVGVSYLDPYPMSSLGPNPYLQ